MKNAAVVTQQALDARADTMVTLEFAVDEEKIDAHGRERVEQALRKVVDDLNNTLHLNMRRFPVGWTVRELSK